MIKYVNTTENITETMLQGFFVGWPNPPTPATHLKILQNSSYIWLAIAPASNQVVGFITAISDEILSAYIPLLEVLPTHQNQGIGTELIAKMLNSLKHLYMIDLLHDPHLQPYYKSLGLTPAAGSIIRNHSRQNGEPLIDSGSKPFLSPNPQ